MDIVQPLQVTRKGCNGHSAMIEWLNEWLRRKERELRNPLDETEAADDTDRTEPYAD